MNSTTENASADRRDDRILGILAAALGVAPARNVEAVANLRNVRLDELPTDSAQAAADLQATLREHGLL
jgi:hypothetical protein